jgi:hypothetical protein
VSGTVTTFKLFFAHQDEEQEAWLRSMAQQGLHLLKVNPFCFWTFRRGEPADVVYRVDFPRNSQDPDFAQLMQVAGWTLAATTVGWHYWRTQAVRGAAPELFSDIESKLRNFRHRLGIFVACAMPLFVMLVITDKQRALEQLSLPFLLPLVAALLLWVLVMPYTIVQLMLKIRKLGNPLPG